MALLNDLKSSTRVDKDKETNSFDLTPGKVLHFDEKNLIHLPWLDKSAQNSPKMKELFSR